MNCICLITFQPRKIWCDFLNTFKHYKIFIIVDDNDFDLCVFKNEYTNINFITVKNETCKLSGYMNTNYMINKLISGWDKALYYFGLENTGVENTGYDFIWFIEDDVFFNNENTILNIDKQYVNEDLLSSPYYINKDGNKHTWNWSRININFPPPYYHGMMCVVRFSKMMLKCINNYANLHKTLFFLEALFPTIAIKHKLKYATPNELSDIYYRHNFQQKDIRVNNFYHPVKNLKIHVFLRNNFLSPVINANNSDNAIRRFRMFI